jgi:hemin uptake protein HemP
MSESKGGQKELNQKEVETSSPVLHVEDLFQGQREICIEHDGKHYRLRITRRNKLILQK